MPGFLGVREVVYFNWAMCSKGRQEKEMEMAQKVKFEGKRVFAVKVNGRWCGTLEAENPRKAEDQARRDYPGQEIEVKPA